MMRLACFLAFLPGLVLAEPRVDATLDTHILPGFNSLSEATANLAQSDSCAPEQEWRAAVDAWTAVSHLRFGPLEADNRGFVLAFWPDPRGATPKALNDLLAENPPPLADASVAGRGLYAMEFLLFDPAFAEREGRCALIAALADDTYATARAIETDWRDRFAPLLRTPGNDTYQSDQEALQELYKALLTGLLFTSETRLGRPLGTFDRARPKRAEMRRSGQSLANTRSALDSLRQLAGLLAAGHPVVAADLDAGFAKALLQVDEIETLDGGADLSLVASPASRLKVEILQQDINAIRNLASAELGPLLGVIAGFNSLDGD